MCGRPGGRPASVHARPARPAEAPPQRQESSGPPCGAARRRGRGTPAEGWGGLVTRLRNVPVPTYPVFLPPAGDRQPLFIPGYRIHGGFCRAECLNVPPTLHPKGLPTQKGPPVVEGCLLALKSRFLNWGEGENQSEWSPEVIALNLQNGLEWVVYSSLQIMLFLILFCLLQPHAPFARSHPDNWHSPRPGGSVFLHEGSEAGRQAHAAAGEGGRALAAPRLPPASRRWELASFTELGN